MPGTLQVSLVDDAETTFTPSFASQGDTVKQHASKMRMEMILMMKSALQFTAHSCHARHGYDAIQLEIGMMSVTQGRGTCAEWMVPLMIRKPFSSPVCGKYK